MPYLDLASTVHLIVNTSRPDGIVRSSVYMGVLLVLLLLCGNPRHR